jgi:predicted DCC family thiol-disulfide oxidoreductase YuxK
MRRLYVLYDADCGLCSRIRRWAERQPAFVELDFVAAQSARARQWFPTLAGKGEPEELVVVSDEGGVYREDNSWIMVLYALQPYRDWAIRLSRPWLLPHARAAFNLLTQNRKRVSDWLGLVSDRDLVETLRGATAPPRCARGTNP